MRIQESLFHLVAGIAACLAAAATLAPATACLTDGDCADIDPCTDEACIRGACRITPRNCDLGDPCTTWTCSAPDGCVYFSSPRPGEVPSLTVGGPMKDRISWLADPPASSYEVVRGSLGKLPVGPILDDEACFGDVHANVVVDPLVPPSGQGFWYVVRAVGCSQGPYGSATAGVRETATCDPIEIDSPVDGAIVNDGTPVVAGIPVPLVNLVEWIQFEYSPVPSDGKYAPIVGVAPEGFPGFSAIWAVSSLPPGPFTLRGLLKLVGRPAPIPFPLLQPQVTVNAQPVSVATVNFCQDSGGSPTVQLSAALSFDSDGAIQDFSWDFEDGSFGAGETIDHTYPKPGQYPFALTVTDERGGTTTSHYVLTAAPPAQCVAAAKTDCGCSSMDILTSGATVPADLIFAPESDTGIPAAAQKELGAYNDGVVAVPPALPQLDMTKTSFNIRNRFEVEGTLKDKSKPQLCAEGQRVRRTSKYNGPQGGPQTEDNKLGVKSSDPRYHSNAGADDPYTNTDDPAIFEQATCAFGTGDWCDDNYHGDGGTDGAGTGDKDPTTVRKKYDGEKRIAWVDAPGMKSMKKQNLSPSGLTWKANFEAKISGNTGTCSCTWDVVIEITSTGEVTKNQVENEVCTHSEVARDGLGPHSMSRAVELRVSAAGDRPELGDAGFEFAVARPRAMRIQILDERGRLVRTLIDGVRAAGEHRALWNRRDDRGRLVHPGSYTYVVRAGDWHTEGRLTVLGDR